MPFESGLTPLADTDLVGEDDRARLGKLGIVSVEELADAIASSPDSISKALRRPPDSIRELLARALALLDDPTRKALSEPRTKYATGALPPHRKSST